MTRNSHLILGMLALSAVCMIQVANSQTSPSNKSLSKSGTSATSKHKSKLKPVSPPAVSTEDLDKVKQMVVDQQKAAQQQFDTLKEQNDQLGQQLKLTQDKLASAEEQINRLTTEPNPEITKLQSAVTAVKSDQATTSAYVLEQKKLQPQREHPLALNFKGVTLTPGGFLAAEALFRTHAENADINTSWNGIPYDDQTMAHLTEFRQSARQSRIALRADGDIRAAHLTGYYEMDFLGTGYSASEVQGNTWSDRIRQIWARAQFANGWTFAGGQMWSLITTNRRGIDNLAEFLVPLADGTAYMGNDYARQNAFRITKSFANDKITAAFSVENAATVGITPANVPTSVSSLISGLATTGTGALSNTTYSTNVAPDLIFKTAFDPKFGHFEFKAIGRTFRDRINSTPAVAATKTTPAVAATPGYNNTTLDGAIGGAALVPVFTKRITYIAEANWGAIGRYGATSTDVIVKPDGTLSPEKSLHALTGFETHPTARLDWNVYGSGEYLPRNYGYGLATIKTASCFVEATVLTYACPANVRSLTSVATGFWYRLYKGPVGTVQFGGDWVYLNKNTWTGVSGAPKAVENVFDTSFRYYIP